MRSRTFRRLALAAATVTLCASPSRSAPSPRPDDFLAFPLATVTSAAKVPAFAWLVRKGDRSIVMFARAPGFERVQLFSRGDEDGQPVTDLDLSPDGRFAIFQTGGNFAGERAYNPASLIETPKPLLWLVETRAGAQPVQIGPGISPLFSPDGRQLLYRHERDIWALDLAASGAQPRMLIRGGAAFSDTQWSKDGQSLLFVQDRGGYSFLGRYRLGAERVEWIVTGADRLGSPVLSPDGNSVAYLRFPGRQQDVVYDATEAEPFAVEVADLATGKVRTLFETRERALLSRLGDPDSALRWMGPDRLVFYSEQDGWGRLYSVPARGGDPRPLTPANCEVAESEAAGPETLLVVHNCRDLDRRQLSIVNARTGAERPLRIDDAVASGAVKSEGSDYLAFTGGGTDSAPLLRVLDLKRGAVAMAEKSSDYGWTAPFSSRPPEAVRFQAEDGVTVPAQLFLPKGRGPHPALIYVHGGPQRQMFPGFHFSEYYARSFAMNRRLADQGYAVLSVNFRSGVGYGRAFREAERRGWRGASEYADVLAAGRWLAARPDVDRERIGIWGGSYGGLLTAQALSRNSDLFKAGSAIHGVFDWSWRSSKEGHLNPSRFFGVSEADRPAARAASPISTLQGWRSPVLLFSGDQDMNVDVLETVDLAQKLRTRGVDVRTVILPGEAHSFVRHSSWFRLWEEQKRFFDEKLRASSR